LKQSSKKGKRGKKGEKREQERGKKTGKKKGEKVVVKYLSKPAKGMQENVLSTRWEFVRAKRRFEMQYKSAV